jgi:DNA-binding SARP family transcriptional activator
MHIASDLQAPKGETSSYARGAEISIHILGPQVILRNGEEIHPPAPQQRRVLAVLASHPGEVVAREAISQRIWGAATAQQLRSLQSYISHLRTILGTHAIELVGGGYRLNIGEDQIDEVQFRHHVERGLDCVGQGHFREARAHLEVALKLYRGKPYDDLPNGDFAVRRAGLLHLRDAAEDALLRMRVDLVRNSQDCDGLIPLLAQAYADHPDRELRALLYARTLAMAGRLSEAGDVVRDFRTRLKEHTGAEPSAEFLEVTAHLARHDGAALSRAWGSQVNLPPFSGPLVGRDLEVHAVATMLEVGGSPLVTISGVTGVGKTRVAAAVARSLADDLPGGVVWVDASTASSGDDVLARIAEAVGIEGTPVALRSTLPRALGDRRTLVVVDGLERVDAEAALAVVLGSGPRVSVIVTSSDRVGLASEHVMTLHPLATSGGAASQAGAFVVAVLNLLAPGATFDSSAIDEAIAQTEGVPSALEQVALNLISQH